jgi:hypothetical protein
MHRPGAQRPSNGRSGTHARTAHRGRARANRPFVDRLSRRWSALRTQRNSGTRCRLPGSGGLRLREPRHQIRARRNHWPLSGLTYQSAWPGRRTKSGALRLRAIRPGGSGGWPGSHRHRRRPWNSRGRSRRWRRTGSPDTFLDHWGPRNDRRARSLLQAAREWLPRSGQSRGMGAGRRRSARNHRRRGKNLAGSGLRKNLSGPRRHRQRPRRNYGGTRRRRRGGRSERPRRRCRRRRVGDNRRTNGNRSPHRRLDRRRLGRYFRLASLRRGFDGRRLDGLFHFLRTLFERQRAIVILAVIGVRSLAIAHRLDSETNSQLVGDILVDRARMRQLFRHTELRQKVQNEVGFHLQLPREDIDTDLLHKQTKCKRGDS